jgi:hypothetical protein
MMNANHRRVVKVDAAKPNEFGCFAYAMTPAFAAKLIQQFEASLLHSVDSAVDAWILKQLPERQIQLDVPIVFAEHLNASASNVMAKLSSSNKLLHAS